FDPTGTKLLTGDLDGIVRVGPISGDDPRLLLGHEGSIATVLVSPDGKWIASTDNKSTLRLWRMPEGKPFSSLSYDQLLNRLRDLTNVRAMTDKHSPNGYHIQYTPFPGWDKP